MEPVTQGLLGASFGQALYGRRLGRRALVWGAAAGMLPDVDVAWSQAQPVGEFLYHRGFTHAFWFGPVAGTLVGWLLWRFHGRAPGRLRDWIGLAGVAIFTHPLLDICTSYGTQFLTPFSDARLAIDAVAIVDPAYSLILAAAIAIGARCGWASAAASRAAIAGLALSTAYLGWGLVLNARAESAARAQLRAEGFGDAEVRAYPTLLQLHFRRIVAHAGPRWQVGWISTWNGRDARFSSFEEPGHPLVEAALATPEGRVLAWFANGQVAGRAIEAAGATIVELDDLRYGLPGEARNGLWGLRFRFDDSGRLRAPVERFNRPLPAEASALVRQLLREAYFN